jgi:quinol monooxygenase YgiN
MPYGYIGSMRVRSGHRDEVIEILLSGADGLRAAGCQLYAVCTAPGDDDVIWVSEIWDSAEQHDASLQLPETKAAIARAERAPSSPRSGRHAGECLRSSELATSVAS